MKTLPEALRKTNTIEVKTLAQARIMNRLYLLKIAVQITVLALLLLACGWKLWMVSILVGLILVLTIRGWRLDVQTQIKRFTGKQN
ncbi:MAG: hypothetical protein SFV17_03170 [Candidatus Obscuribacter sp.]|nr:hypothetical protein [Candidatus Melainabacteria bacterium]MDX1985666.1 hypothetical protein [Candidatus Obscuribacter sp.]